MKRTGQTHSARSRTGQAEVAEELSLRPPGFGYRTKTAGRAELFCESVSLDRLAARYGTPLYVYSADAIRARLNAFARAFSSVPHTICYSVKANSTLGILRLIASSGAGFDIVSGGELRRVLRVAQQTANRVVFSGVGKTQDEMRLALRARILLFNVESASELRVMAQTAGKLRKIASMAIRVNPDVPAETHPYISTGLHEHKFGMPMSEARVLYAEAAEHKSLKVAGISVHIGSQITDVSSFQAALERVAELVRELRGEGHDIRYVDAGGGLGIGYEGPPNDFKEQIAAYAHALLTPLKGLNVHLLIEPGRSITGPAGVLLTRVLYRKTNNSKRFLIVDAAMNDMLRPSLYGAYHEIVPVIRESSSSIETTDIVGPICETGDFFARDRELPQIEEGELLAILDTGAYGSVLASNYNSRGRAAEILVSGRTAKLIRRRESVEDLMRVEQ